jgi:hypothetical protein
MPFSSLSLPLPNPRWSIRIITKRINPQSPASPDLYLKIYNMEKYPASFLKGGRMVYKGNFGAAYGVLLVIPACRQNFNPEFFLHNRCAFNPQKGEKLF